MPTVIAYALELWVALKVVTQHQSILFELARYMPRLELLAKPPVTERTSDYCYEILVHGEPVEKPPRLKCH